MSSSSSFDVYCCIVGKDEVVSFSGSVTSMDSWVIVLWHHQQAEVAHLLHTHTDVCYLGRIYGWSHDINARSSRDQEYVLLWIMSSSFLLTQILFLSSLFLSQLNFIDCRWHTNNIWLQCVFLLAFLWRHRRLRFEQRDWIVQGLHERDLIVMIWFRFQIIFWCLLIDMSLLSGCDFILSSIWL